jgi:hypothetical protein
MFEAYRAEFDQEPPDAIWKPERVNQTNGFNGTRNGTKLGGALPDCCSYECVKPECKSCVGCSATYCGVLQPENGTSGQKLSIAPDQFAGYVPTNKPRAVGEDVKYLCEMEPFFYVPAPHAPKMKLFWTISNGIIYMEHQNSGERW